MELGMLINTNHQIHHAIMLTKTALQKGHSVRMFIMDEGSYALENPELVSFCEDDNVKISFCEYNARQHKINLESIDRRIKRGTQLNNAIMCQQSDKILVL